MKMKSAWSSYLQGIAVLSVLVSSPLRAEVTKFPQDQYQAQSPDRRFAVINQNRDELPNHVLSLLDEQRGKSWLILLYRRHVDVSWSNNSTLFFVNDYEESDISDCYLFSTTDRQWKMSVMFSREVHSFMNRHPRESHIFVKCVGWQANDSVKVEISGYGDASHRVSTSRFVFYARNEGDSTIGSR